MTDRIIPTETDGVFVYTSDEGTSFFCDKDGAQLSNDIFDMKQEQQTLGSEFVLETYKRRDLNITKGGNIHTFSEEDINNHKFSGLLDFEILLNDFDISREDINKSWAPNKPRDYEALLKDKSHSELVTMIADMDKGANHMARMNVHGTQAILDAEGTNASIERLQHHNDVLQQKNKYIVKSLEYFMEARDNLIHTILDEHTCFSSNQIHGILIAIKPMLGFKTK